jgi:hypothetical protein
LLLAWSAAFFGFALAQERFANAFAPGLALTLGVAVEEMRGVAKRRYSRQVRVALGALLIASLALALMPAALDYSRLFATGYVPIGQERSVVPVTSRRKATVEAAARFLRTASPPTRGFLDVTYRPAYGVLTAWDDGHLVRYRAARPTVQDNFGSFADRRAYELARTYFDALEEEDAYRIASDLRARYVVATREASGQTLAPSPSSVGQRLWRRLGSGSDQEALARHRLIWVRDPGTPDGEDPPSDRVAVFEIVAGAEVAGEAPPGARVGFELELRTGTQAVLYRASAQASAQGSYRIRLPYPTDAAVSREVEAAGAYRVWAAGREARLEIRERDVRAGASVFGPDLRPDAP